MPLRRIFHLRVDVSTGKVTDESGRVWDASDIPLVRADGNVFRFELVYSPDQGQSYAPFVLTSTMTFKFGIKDPDELSGTEFLAFADNSAFNLTADWDQMSLGNGKICCRFSTNTTAMDTFLTGATKDGFPARAEVEITEAGGEPFTPAQFDVQAVPDVIRGDEGSPAPGAPSYPTTAELNNRLPEGVTYERDGNTVWFCIDGVRVTSWTKP